MYVFQFVDKCTCGNYKTFPLIRLSGVKLHKSQQLPFCLFNHCVHTKIKCILYNVVNVLNKVTTVYY